MLDFGDYTVEVVTSLHSRNAGYSVGFARRTCGGPTQAGKVQDLPEGDTLAYQLTARGGPSVFFIGASDFVERNLAGLAPDAAMITVPNTDVTHAYVPRLLAALDWPATVVPVHWDHFEVALRNPPTVTPNDQDRLDLFCIAVRKGAPRTRILQPIT